jgi:Rv0078B-related antitoxin
MQGRVTPGTGANKPTRPTSCTLNRDSFRMTLDLFQTGIDVMRQNLRRRHPEATAEHVERLLGEWLRERPGAEFGDGAGRTVDVKTFLA